MGSLKGMLGQNPVQTGTGILGMGMEMAFKKQAMDLDMKQKQMDMAFEKQKFDLLKSVQEQQMKNEQARIKVQQDKLKWEQDLLKEQQTKEEGEKEERKGVAYGGRRSPQIDPLQAMARKGFVQSGQPSFLQLMKPKESEKPIVHQESGWSLQQDKNGNWKWMAPPEEFTKQVGKTDYYDQWYDFTNDKKVASLLQNVEPNASLMNIFTKENTGEIIDKATDLFGEEHNAWEKEKGGFFGLGQKPEPTFESALSKIILQYYPELANSPQEAQPQPSEPVGPVKPTGQPPQQGGLSKFLSDPMAIWKMAGQAKPIGFQDFSRGMQTGLAAGTPFPFGTFGNATPQPINPATLSEATIKRGYEIYKQKNPNGLTYEQYRLNAGMY